jgi:hypothetical protein
MSYRAGGPMIYRPAGAAATGARSESLLPCRWCGQLGGDIVHYDVSPGGRTWAEHRACRSRRRRDWLADGRIP